MAETARVHSIDALKTLKIALWKFTEAANVAMGDAESEMRRVLTWLETEQSAYWASELRNRHTAVQKCKEAIRMKEVFKDATGARQTAIDERKALTRALKRLEEAEQKAVATKQWVRRLQKEILLYKGQVQRFASNLASDIPVAVASLEQMVGTLEEYVGLAPTEAQSQGEGFAREGAAGMARGADSAASEPAIKFPELRQRTATAASRINAVDADISQCLWKSGAMSIFDHELFEWLALPLADVDEKSTLTLADKCWESRAIYLERLLPEAQGDSGWFVGAVSRKEADIRFLQVKLGDLLKVRPDFRDILRLPTGCLAVFDGRGVKTILDPKNHDIWADAERDKAVREGAETQEP